MLRRLGLVPFFIFMAVSHAAVTHVTGTRGELHDGRLDVDFTRDDARFVMSLQIRYVPLDRITGDGRAIWAQHANLFTEFGGDVDPIAHVAVRVKGEGPGLIRLSPLDFRLEPDRQGKRLLNLGEDAKEALRELLAGARTPYPALSITLEGEKGRVHGVFDLEPAEVRDFAAKLFPSWPTRVCQVLLGWR